MSHIPARMRRLSIKRADNRWAYCLLSQVGQEATFHIDHIIPESQGGKTRARQPRARLCFLLPEKGGPAIGH